MARRVTSVVILGAFLGIALLAFLGNLWLATVFFAVEAFVLGHHALSLCKRCSNTACGFNRLAPRHGQSEAQDVVPYSNLPVTRTTIVPLLAAYPLAVVAAWRFSPLATIAVGAVGLAAHSVFRRLTCRNCGNDCIGNCNERYRAWRAHEREHASQPV